MLTFASAAPPHSTELLARSDKQIAFRPGQRTGDGRINRQHQQHAMHVLCLHMFRMHSDPQKVCLLLLVNSQGDLAKVESNAPVTQRVTHIPLCPQLALHKNTDGAIVRAPLV